MQVGLQKPPTSSDAHRESSSPSALTVKVERALSGATWARATTGTRKNATMKSKRDGFMAVGSSTGEGRPAEGNTEGKSSIAAVAGGMPASFGGPAGDWQKALRFAM